MTFKKTLRRKFHKLKHFGNTIIFESTLGILSVTSIKIDNAIEESFCFESELILVKSIIYIQNYDP